MSGDLGAEVVVRAANQALREHPQLELLLVGDENEIQGHVTRIVGDEPRLSIVHASEIVEMSDSPVDAMRKKKDSSMRVAINLVKEGRAQACVSAGNTGALMATAKYVLKMLPGMGSIVTEDITGVENPRVALLNIGAEDTKGHDTVKDAAAMLTASTLNYVGFIEGSELFTGKADVVVTDGFTGNVALKTMEGTVGLAAHYLKRAFTRNLFSKFQALLARPVLKHLRKRMDPRDYNGATLVGLNGIVIKSHGSADSFMRSTRLLSKYRNRCRSRSETCCKRKPHDVLENCRNRALPA
jgi:glycerol-3-phosphate acyltransferase PlsX